MLQFEDRIVVTWLKDKKNGTLSDDFQTISKPEDMIKLHMIRGRNEKIFYIESTNTGEKIMMLGFDETAEDSVEFKEVYNFTNNRVVLFALDNDSYSSASETSQAFYVVDEDQNIYHIANGSEGELDHFRVTTILNFRQHNLQKQMRQLLQHNWSNAVINNRAIRFNSCTYSLGSQLKHERNFSTNDKNETVYDSWKVEDFK